MNYEKQAKDFAKKYGVKLEVLSNSYGKHFVDDENERRIFRIRLSRNENSYEFDFGQSIQNSTLEITKPQSEVLDEIEVYAGLRTDTSSAGIKFTLRREKEFALTDEEYEALSRELVSEYYTGINVATDKISSAYKQGKISRNLMDAKLSRVNRLPDGAFQQVIQNAIRRELNKEVVTYVKSDEIIEPTMYDVLATLTKYDPETFEDFCGNYGYDEDSRKAEKVYHSVVEEWKNIDLLFHDVMEEFQEIQ